jgi:integrase
MTTLSKRKVLSDRVLNAVPVGSTAVDLSDLQQRGLIARVLPSGTIQFVVRYRWKGKNRRHKLGTYSDKFTIAKARSAARAVIVQVEAGEDPAGERQAQRQTPIDTVDALVEAYLEKYAKPRKRSAAEDERVLRVDVLPRWKGRAVQSLTRRDVRDVLDRIVERGAPYAANRTFEVVRRMLNWAVEQDWIDASPASHVKKPSKEYARDRVLTDDEIRKLWRCLSHFRATAQKRAPGRKHAPSDPDDPFCPLSPRLAAVQKVRLLTAQRGGEVLRMKWADVELDAKRWTIPAEDSKNGKPHVVPLTDTVIAIITAQPRRAAKDEDKGSVYVFGGGGEKDLLPTHRIARAGADLAEALGIEMRSHDLRRTAATIMVRAGVPREHVSRVLNHTPPGPVATRVYDRHSYDPEKRVALETLDRVIDGILTKKPSATVVPMRRA